MKYDCWLANGSPDFGVIKGGIPGIAEADAPIRLQRGDNWFGATHIALRHRHWVEKQKATVPALVWQKCRQPGHLYSAEEPSKGKIWLPVIPSALMLLRYIPARNFWSVITLYFHEGALDGEYLGRYSDGLEAPDTDPKFTIAEPRQQPKITYRRKRT